jgi:hypothetical protein
VVPSKKGEADDATARKRASEARSRRPDCEGAAHRAIERDELSRLRGLPRSACPRAAGTDHAVVLRNGDVTGGRE